MGKLGSVIVNNKAEEGGNPGSESVEEVTMEDFDSGYSRVQADGGGGECWIKYPRGYVHSLANFAWQQAVNNKPLTDPAAGAGRTAAATETAVLDGSGDDEKEEGELEEGEIDGDISGGEESTSEAVRLEVVANEESSDTVLVAQLSEIEPEDTELMKKTKSVEQVFITLIETKGIDKSFRLICSEARSSLDTLLQLTLDNFGYSLVYELVQKAFLLVESVYSAFCDRTPEERQLHEDDLLWFFCHVKEKTRALFSQSQMDEVESLIKLVVSNSYNSIKNNKATKCVGLENNIIPNNLLTASSSLQNADDDNSCRGGVTIVEALKRKPTVVNSKGRKELGPLLDLHIDYDESSLPSPTRAAPTLLSALKPWNDTERPISTGIAMIHGKDRMGENTQHASITDVVKAVSSYQQKFGRTSHIMSDRLPSPTPSDDNDEEGSDHHGEVSSFSRSSSGMMNAVLQSSQVQVYKGSDIIGGTGREVSPDQRPGLGGSGTSSAVRTSAKNRDPRRRPLSSQTDCGFVAERTIPMDNFSSPKTRREGVLVSRKPTDVDMMPVGNDLKRPRIGKNDPIIPRDPRLVGREGGGSVENSFTTHLTSSQHMTQFMDVDVGKPMNESLKSNTINGNGGSFDASTSTSLPTDISSLTDVSLPSLLKEIAAVNPTMLFQLIQLEQKRLASSSQNNSVNLGTDGSHPSSSMLLSPAPSITDNGITMFTQSDRKSREKPQNLVQGSLKNAESDAGIVRMKPRDPRRILQTKMVHKTEDFESDELKKGVVAVTSYVDASRESTPVLGQSEQAETPFTSSLPDIGLQFTKTLKKVADIVSHPQFESTSQSTLSNDPQRDEGDINDERIVPQRDEGDINDDEGHFNKHDVEENAFFQRERARRLEEQNKMFAVRKLCLVLDLDHTLLNSAKFMEIDPPHEEMLRKKEEIDREKLDRHLFKFPHLSMWTKLRPGIWNFLEKASKLFELHLYTMGNKLYATEMAKILDPTGVLFSGRVISRGDDGESGDGEERMPKSKDLDGVLGMESAVIIIDDSVRVWPLHRHNLILVERYTFFPCSRRQFGLLGPSLLEIDHDERPEDGTLASCLAVIERIHQIFFSHPCLDEVDVRSILANEQSSILSGCRILFSRIFPVGEANPHLHPLWQTAEQFGAVCTNQIDELVTHVVANSLGTDKVNWALTRGIFVVHPGWVEASALLYRRANERDFAVKQ